MKIRKPRKDRGTKRPRTKGKKTAVNDAEDDDDEGGDDDEEERPRKRRAPKSAETIPEDD